MTVLKIWRVYEKNCKIILKIIKKSPTYMSGENAYVLDQRDQHHNYVNSLCKLNFNIVWNPIITSLRDFLKTRKVLMEK